MSERRTVAVVLVVVAATGIVDAACLLHLEVFTAYVTGSLILLGAHLVGVPGSPVPNLVAIAGFVAGSLVGSLLVRRQASTPRSLGVALVLVAALVFVAAGAAGRLGIEGAGAYTTIGLLGAAMGVQLAAIHRAAVADVALPAATLVIYHLTTSAPVIGGRPERTGRRLGVVAALVAGAALGAAVSRWEPWAAWAAAGVVISTAAAIAFAAPEPASRG